LTRINLDLVMADRRNRIALHPVGVLDRFVGATGYVVDHEYVAKELLPRIIERRDSRGFRVAVYHAGSGQTLYGTGTRERLLVRAPLRFAMADHVIEVSDDLAGTATLARRTFIVNVVLLIFIAFVGIAGVMVTLRAARAEMALATLKHDFVSTVTHELRTPLASIRLFGRLIRTGTAANLEETRTFGAHIEKESERLTAMIERVLDLARMEGRDWRPAFTEVDLRAVVHDAMQLHEPRLRQEAFAVSCRLPDEPVLVRGNREALASALSNLIENAINYSTAGMKAIEVDLRSNGEISVRDRGIGIAPADADHIYERFYRADSEAVRAVRGAGLGLAMVRATVEVHGGRIALQSRPGTGSTFTLVLPREVG